jgi:nucleoside-diphosphate-sugar epimerase
VLDPYRGARALVTGSAGFIGRWVAKLLSDAGAELLLLERNKTPLDTVASSFSIRGTRIAADLAVKGEFARVYNEVRPDITFNLAGYGISREETSEASAWRINAELVEEIVSVIGRGRERRDGWKGLSLVHTGSGFELGSVPGVVTEEVVPNPATLYGKTKLAGTRSVQAGSTGGIVRAVAARLFTVFGPGEGSQRLLPSLLRAARSKEPLKMTKGEQLRDFTYVKDVAAGLLRLGLSPQVPGGTVNLATGNLLSVREFVECAADLLGMGRDQLLFGAIPYREDEILQGRVDIRLLRRITGWTPSYSVRDGIKETIELENSNA